MPRGTPAPHVILDSHDHDVCSPGAGPKQACRRKAATAGFDPNLKGVRRPRYRVWRPGTRRLPRVVDGRVTGKASFM